MVVLSLAQALPHEDQIGSGETSLTGVSIEGRHQGGDGIVQLGVGHDEHEVLGARHGDDPLAGLAAPFVDHVTADGRRSNEADPLDPRVVQHAGDHSPATVDNVPDTGRDARLLREFCNLVLTDGILAGRLHHDAVPCGDGVRGEPKGHHIREVEGTDHAEYAEWLPDEVLVDSRGDILQGLAHHERWDARGHLHVLDTSPRFSPGLVDGLPVLHGLDPAQLLEALLKELLQPEEASRPGEGRGSPPFREGFPGRLDGRVDFGLGGDRHARDGLLGGGVHHVHPFAL